MCHLATRRLGPRRALGYPAADLRSDRQAGELLTRSMTRLRLVPLLALLVAAAFAGSASAQVAYSPDTPKPGALYANGQNGRFLVGREGLVRLGPGGQGLSQAWQ